MAENQIDDIITSAIEKIKNMSSIKTVVGEPISVEGVTMLPISKMSVGFIAGGGEYNSSKDAVKKIKSYPFSGGSGGGVCVHPVGFICIVGKSVKYIKANGESPFEKVVETIPSLVRSLIDGLKNDEK